MVQESLKSSRQCAGAAAEANKIMGMIERNITWKTKEVVTRLYKSLVRRHLEYCIQFWSPYYRKNYVHWKIG